MNNQDLFVLQDEATLHEAHQHHTLFDVANLVDEMGVDRFIYDLLPLLNNPREQHILSQLYGVLQHHEPVLLSMNQAHEVLKRGE